jgi:hypothetical protein
MQGSAASLGAVVRLKRQETHLTPLLAAPIQHHSPSSGVRSRTPHCSEDDSKMPSVPIGYVTLVAISVPLGSTTKRNGFLLLGC